MGMQMNNLSKLRWGLTGAIICLPFGFAAAGLAKESDFLTWLLGTEWALFRVVVVAFAMIGYGVGQALYKSAHKKDEKDRELSDF
jgi:hypothetical protein